MENGKPLSDFIDGDIEKVSVSEEGYWAHTFDGTCYFIKYPMQTHRIKTHFKCSIDLQIYPGDLCEKIVIQMISREAAKMNKIVNERIKKLLKEKHLWNDKISPAQTK